jgi:hypothetical protein
MFEAKPRTGSKCEDSKSNPVRIGGFEMTSHTNKSLLKVRWINFDSVRGLKSFRSSPRTATIYFTRYPLLSCEQNKAIWLASLSWIINEFEIATALCGKMLYHRTLLINWNVSRNAHWEPFARIRLQWNLNNPEVLSAGWKTRRSLS